MASTSYSSVKDWNEVRQLSRASIPAASLAVSQEQVAIAVIFVAGTVLVATTILLLVKLAYWVVAPPRLQKRTGEFWLETDLQIKELPSDVSELDEGSEASSGENSPRSSANSSYGAAFRPEDFLEAKRGPASPLPPEFFAASGEPCEHPGGDAGAFAPTGLWSDMLQADGAERVPTYRRSKFMASAA
mmetsp:Transcript_11914/g.28278  ORF Transcript_11914/g.28278 Transcript_11914/m.28278 type:complete len:188 (+) Transcript_11914:161-724(+)